MALLHRAGRHGWPVRDGDDDMANAPHDGTYTDANGDRFIMRTGQPLPDGAIVDADAEQEPATEERARPAAPENKAKGKAAPENRGA